MTTYNGKSLVQLAAQHIKKNTTFREVAEQINATRAERTLGHKVVDTAQVDGKPWYTIRCNLEISKWIRVQEGDWQEHLDQNWNVWANTFDLSEELYILLALKFGK